jgi:hypothetical protein
VGVSDSGIPPPGPHPPCAYSLCAGITVTTGRRTALPATFAKGVFPRLARGKELNVSRDAGHRCSDRPFPEPHRPHTAGDARHWVDHLASPANHDCLIGLPQIHTAFFMYNVPIVKRVESSFHRSCSWIATEPARSPAADGAGQPSSAAQLLTPRLVSIARIALQCHVKVWGNQESEESSRGGDTTSSGQRRVET